MDEEKKNVNTEDKTNNMDYSFDFANQVEETPSVQEPVSENIKANDNASVEQALVTDEPVQTVENTATTQNNSQTVDASQTVENTDTTQNNSQTVDAPQAVENTATTQNNSQTVDASQTVENTDTTDQTTINEEDSEELIKDKKATKKFLIILFVIVLAFIIALPLIKGFLG